MTDPNASETPVASAAGGSDPAPKAAPSLGRRIAKWLAIVVGAIVLLVALGVAGVTQTSKSRANRLYPVNPSPITALGSPEDLAEGERLVRARGCAECHGENLAGRTALDEMPMARIIGANLTGGQGSRIATFTDEDIARIIRWGVYPDGHGVFFMPSHEFHAMPDQELGRIIGYLRSVPPVDNDPGQSAMGIIGRMLHVTRAMPMYPAEWIDHSAEAVPSFDRNDPIEFGSYLAEGCRGCHGHGLSGGKIPGAPPSMPIPLNLTQDESGLAGWTLADFTNAVRSGTKPDGTQLDPFMPYGVYASFSDEEVGALWAYLQTVPQQPFGNR